MQESANPEVVVVISSSDDEAIVRRTKDISIHPGVVNGRRVHPLTRSNKPSKKNGRVMARVLKRFDQRHSAWELTIKSLPAAVNPQSFKKPGSRNPKKLRKR
jgi:hypothetical protein